MTPDEWIPIVETVRDAWPQQPWPKGTIALGYTLLNDLEAADVRSAVLALAGTGREFAPPPGLLRQRVISLRQPGMTFEDAWAEITREISAHGRYEEAKAREVLLPKANGMVWQLVTAMGGWNQICNGGFDEYKPTDPGVWRSQAEHAWKALDAQRREDASLADLASDLPRIQAARERQGGLSAIKDVIPSLPGKPEGNGKS